MNVDDHVKSSGQSSLGLSTRLNVNYKMQKRQVEIKGLHASIKLTLKDKDEKTVVEKDLPANSFVLNFMRLLYTAMTASTHNVTDTNGSVVTAKLAKIEQHVHYEVEYKETEYDRYIAGYHAWAPKEDDSHGVMVGGGTTTVTEEDYRLEAKIPNGLGSGQMIYLYSRVGETQTVGNEAHLFITRSFINHSGDSIMVREVGVAVMQVSPIANILIIRDLVEETEVPNDYTLDVQYTLEITV